MDPSEYVIEILVAETPEEFQSTPLDILHVSINGEAVVNRLQRATLKFVMGRPTEAELELFNEPGSFEVVRGFVRFSIA